MTSVPVPSKIAPVLESLDRAEHWDLEPVTSKTALLLYDTKSRHRASEQSTTLCALRINTAHTPHTT